MKNPRKSDISGRFYFNRGQPETAPSFRGQKTAQKLFKAFGRVFYNGNPMLFVGAGHNGFYNLEIQFENIENLQPEVPGNAG